MPNFFCPSQTILYLHLNSFLFKLDPQKTSRLSHSLLQTPKTMHLCQKRIWMWSLKKLQQSFGRSHLNVMSNDDSFLVLSIISVHALERILSYIFIFISKGKVTEVSYIKGIILLLIDIRKVFLSFSQTCNSTLFNISPQLALKRWDSRDFQLLK